MGICYHRGRSIAGIAMHEYNPGFALSAPRQGKIALLGYLIESFEAAHKLGLDFVAVVPPGFEVGLQNDGIDAIVWDFDLINDQSDALLQQCLDRNVRVAVPLYEECVEWAGALNARIQNNPRLFNRGLLFRDKAMMKRKAQMSGLRVGVFEEVYNRDDVKRFFKRVNEALMNVDGDVEDPVHLKPTRAAGSVGHCIIRSNKNIDELPDDVFPCMVESHLDGQEFSVEAFIHNGKIWFMNINEYVHLGYSQVLPPGPELEAERAKIRRAVEKLVKAFNMDNGVIHPEYFIDAEGELNFGEVANRIPGGHIFDLIHRAYGFDPFAAQLLCADPQTSDAELIAFFPDEVNGIQGYAGNVMIYPQKPRVTMLDVPEELLSDPLYEKHDMFEPVNAKVAERVGFGNHYGKINFYGDDPEAIKQRLIQWEKFDFYK